MQQLLSPTSHRLLFVCMGNICRSPTAHAIMQHKIQLAELTAELVIDSAGTHAHHLGEPPDARASQVAMRRGVSTAGLSARKLTANDFHDFDCIYAMDKHNLELIHAAAPNNGRAKIELFMAAANRASMSEITEVPDPYYGGQKGFEAVFELVALGCDAILNEGKLSASLAP